MPHQCGVGFQRGQLTLAVVEAPTYRGPHILIFSVGNASQRQQLAPGLLIDLKSGQHLFYIDHAGQQTTGLDTAYLALAHATASGKPVTRQSRRFAQVMQRTGQALAILLCTRWIECHRCRCTQSSVNGSAWSIANRFHAM
jgi:hypothetical protein